MKKFMLPLNLQLFAETEPVTENEERPFEIEDETIDPGPEIIDHDDGSFEIVDDEEEGEPDEEVQEQTDAGQERDEEVTEPPKKNETKDAVIAERRKWQERMKALEKKAALADKVMGTVGIQDPDKLQSQLDALEAQKYEQQGYDPQTAQMLVQQQRQISEMQQSLARQKFDVEANSLKSDPFFSDIDEWRDELEPIALKTGQSLEAVYMAYRGRERMKEFQREEEHRRQAAASKKNAARVNTSANGGAPKKMEKVNLTPDQLAMAKIAVKQGVFKSVEEYAKYAKKG